MDKPGHHPHVMPVKAYLAVWGVLVAGTVLTVAASFVHMGPLNVPIMLAIAVTKATLVALFFMHLYYDEKFNMVVFVSSLLFVGLFFGGTLTDSLTRGAVDTIERKPIADEMDRLNSGKKPFVLEEAAEHQPATAEHATTTTQQSQTSGKGAESSTTVTIHSAPPAAELSGTKH